MPTLSPETPVGQLVADRAGRAVVFERFGLDYCCGGKRSVAAACAARGLDPAAVIAALEAADAAQAAEPAGPDWAAAPLPDLVAHLLDTHHAYLHAALPRLHFLAQKVARVHGDAHPELHEVAAIYDRFQAEMADHLGKEEQVLFPLILAGGAPGLGMPVACMEREHDDAGRDLAALRRLTGGYVAPDGACNSYRALLDGLAELERDTHRHVHLENAVLFPRALAALAGA